MTSEQKKALDAIITETPYEELIQYLRNDCLQFAVDCVLSLNESDSKRWTDSAELLAKIVAIHR